MVSENVRVACCCIDALLPQSLVTRSEDKGGEREDQEDSGDDEANGEENFQLESTQWIISVDRGRRVDQQVC